MLCKSELQQLGNIFFFPESCFSAVLKYLYSANDQDWLFSQNFLISLERTSSYLNAQKRLKMCKLQDWNLNDFKRNTAERLKNSKIRVAVLILSSTCEWMLHRVA